MTKVQLQRLIIFLLLLILPTFFIKRYRLLEHKKKVYTTKQAASSLQDVDKEFLVVVVKKRGQELSSLNMISILTQSYSPYRMIILSEGGDRMEQTTVERLSYMYGMKDRLSYFSSDSKEVLLLSCLQYLDNIDDSAVIILLDGNDRLINDHVLDTINDAYRSEDVWLAYGQFVEGSTQKKGKFSAAPFHIRYSKVQQGQWLNSPLKTFYAGLLKQVVVSDDMFNGKISLKDEIFQILKPLVELGKMHICYIQKALCIHEEEKYRAFNP